MSPSTSSSAHLEVLQGPLQGQTLILSEPETTIGRDVGQGISLSHYTEVSRRHARFYTRQGTWCLEDLGATNGTFVNGARATPSFSLVDGAVIKMGDFQARFHLAPSSVQAQSTIPGATQLSPLPVAPYPASPTMPYPMPVGYPVEPPKNPGLATVFSFLYAGMGQLYNGETSKAIPMIIAQSVALIFSFLCFIGAPVVIGLGIWSMIDAYQSAERINREAAGRRY